MRTPPATVFAIDDDDAVRTSLRLLLKSVGVPVETFASAGNSSNASIRTAPDAW